MLCFAGRPSVLDDGGPLRGCNIAGRKNGELIEVERRNRRSRLQRGGSGDEPGEPPMRRPGGGAQALRPSRTKAILWAWRNTTEAVPRSF
jgi:hypothetical protein